MIGSFQPVSTRHFHEGFGTASIDRTVILHATSLSIAHPCCHRPASANDVTTRLRSAACRPHRATSNVDVSKPPAQPSKTSATDIICARGAPMVHPIGRSTFPPNHNRGGSLKNGGHLSKVPTKSPPHKWLICAVRGEVERWRGGEEDSRALRKIGLP